MAKHQIKVSRHTDKIGLSRELLMENIIKFINSTTDDLVKMELQIYKFELNGYKLQVNFMKLSDESINVGRINIE